MIVDHLRIYNLPSENKYKKTNNLSYKKVKQKSKKKD